MNYKVILYSLASDHFVDIREMVVDNYTKLFGISEQLKPPR
nr:MAG TPA: hypothetical protein [Caudoviricetes sp.]